MITQSRWDELFEIANHERPMEPLTPEEQAELAGIAQTLAAIDASWTIDGKPVMAQGNGGVTDGRG